MHEVFATNDNDTQHMLYFRDIWYNAHNVPISLFINMVTEE